MIANTFFISPGDVLYRRKGLFFEHVGVYLGWNLVFQNTPKAGEHFVSLADFTQGHPYRVRRTGVPQHLLNWRTQLRLQQPRRYNLLLNNCEHTASALTDGESWSPQLFAGLVICGLVAFCLARK